MADKHPKEKKARRESLKSAPFSAKGLIVFALVFAAIGGYYLYRTYAVFVGPVVNITFDGQPCDPDDQGNCRTVIATLDWNSSHNLGWRYDRNFTPPTRCMDNWIGWTNVDVPPPPHSHTFTEAPYVIWHVICEDAPHNQTDEKFWRINVNPQPPPAPTVNLTANPTLVQYNGSSTLTWTSTDATSCSASGNWSGGRNTNGSESTGALTPPNKTYTLTCYGPSGNATDSASVGVGQPPQGCPPNCPPPPPGTPPSLTFTASPRSVAYNGSSTLTWSSSRANNCTASGAWSGAKPLSGSQSTGNLTSSKTYTLTCSNAYGTARGSATVAVGSPGQPAPPPPAVEDPVYTNEPVAQEPTITETAPTESKPKHHRNYLLITILSGLLGDLVGVIKTSMGK